MLIECASSSASFEGNIGLIDHTRRISTSLTKLMRVRSLASHMTRSIIFTATTLVCESELLNAG